MKRLLVLALAAFLAAATTVINASENNWSASTNSVRFYESKELGSLSDLPPEYSFNVRQPCQKQQVRTRTLDRFNILPFIDDVYKEVCAVNMSFGQISSTYLKLDGYRDAIESKVNGTLMPVPMTSSAYFVDRSGIYPSTGKLFFIENLPASINIKKDFLGNHSFTLKSNGTPVIYNGSQPYVDAHGLSISANNQWLAGVFVHGKTFVLDRSTHSDFVAVGGNVVYNQGLQPAPRTSVSNDGRFVSLALRDKAPIIYGTACVNIDCNIKLYEPTFAQGINNAEYKRMYFKPGGHLQAYISGEFSSGWKMKRFEIFSSQQKLDEFLEQDKEQRYLALGDSFASGEGAFNYRDGTDHPDNRCHQSLVAYSELISQELSFDEHGSVACSGAKLNDVLYTDPVRDGLTLEQHYNQFEQQSHGKEEESFNDQIYNDLLPGYRQQLNHVREHKPSVVTISISGNDIGFGDKIKVCLWSPSPCYNSPSERASIFEEIKSQFEPTKLRLKEIKNAAYENAKIYVIGYPQMFPDGGGSDCGLNTPFETSERRLANDIVSDLNNMLSKASSAVGVRYVDVQNAMQGHRLCEGGTKAINGLTAGNDAFLTIGYPLGKESFHPNQLGHLLFKETILSQTSNLTLGNPEANSSLSENDISSALIGQLSESDKAQIGDIPVAKYSPDMAPDAVFIQDENLEINLSEGNLVPNETYTAELHSNPVTLGSFSAPNDGSADLDFEIPYSIEPGFHTLFINGPSKDGGQISFYKTIYVGSTKNDVDGDGVGNSDEKCLVGQPANIDADADGIDDACDPGIGEAPQAPEEGDGEPKEPGQILISDPIHPDEEDEPGIIPGVNNTNTSSGVQQASSSVQSTASQTQPASSSSGFQPTSGASPASNGNAAGLLNQGVSSPSLDVVSAPYSTTPSAVATSSTPAFQAAPENGGSPGLAILIIGVFIIAFSVNTWNRYIKTPIPARGSKGKHR